jgi:hypothetical protein
MRKKRHKQLLYEKVKELKEQGWRILLLGGNPRMPDAVAVDLEGNIIAIVVLSKQKRNPRPLGHPKGRSRGHRWTGKRSPFSIKQQYAMFDDILFVIFNCDIEHSERTVMASESWPDEFQRRKEWWNQYFEFKAKELGIVEDV